MEKKNFKRLFSHIKIFTFPLLHGLMDPIERQHEPYLKKK